MPAARRWSGRRPEPEIPARQRREWGDIPGGAALSSLLSVSPFSAYLVHRAKLEYQHNTLQGRFRKYCQDHPWQNWICTVLDLVLRFIVVVIIMVVLVVFIAKALLPLPTISE